MALPYSVYQTAANADKDGVAVSSTNTYYSFPWSGEDSDGYGLTVFFTGTPTGTFTLWGTDKPFASEADDTDWVQDTGFSPINPAGAAGKFRDDGGNAKAYRKRLKYVNASGSGVVKAYVTVPETA